MAFSLDLPSNWKTTHVQWAGNSRARPAEQPASPAHLVLLLKSTSVVFLRGSFTDSLLGGLEAGGSCLAGTDLAEAWDRLAREAAVLWERMGGPGGALAFCLKLCKRAAGSCAAKPRLSRVGGSADGFVAAQPSLGVLELSCTALKS